MSCDGLALIQGNCGNEKPGMTRRAICDDADEDAWWTDLQRGCQLMVWFPIVIWSSVLLLDLLALENEGCLTLTGGVVIL